MRIIFPYSLLRVRKRRDPEVNLGGYGIRESIIRRLYGDYIPLLFPTMNQEARKDPELNLLLVRSSYRGLVGNKEYIDRDYVGSVFSYSLPSTSKI